MTLQEFGDDDEKSVLLENAISSLPPQRQQVFRLCKMDGWSYKEVSEMLGISQSTISDQIVKGTKFVLNQLELHSKVLMDLAFVFLLIS